MAARRTREQTTSAVGARRMRDTEKIVFATSVLGASHIRENKPCQDYSIAWQSEDSGAVVLIVCDGHGSDTYVRSNVGSRLAAEITLAAVKEFVPYEGRIPDPEWILGLQGKVKAHEEVGFGKGEGKVFEALFETIYRRWLEAIEEDSRNNPFSEEEQERLGGKKLAKAYGTTLMAYVQTRDYWFAFQIGDGRMLAADENLQWKQLVPWDENCFLNQTTSLCNTHPLPMFRYAFDGTGSFPAAVFCCSDGIEDSWGDYEVAPHQLHDYFSALAKYFIKEGKDSTLDRLSEFLPKLSAAASKDDMSLAGYINKDAIRLEGKLQ